jgi:hypothetical protein
MNFLQLDISSARPKNALKQEMVRQVYGQELTPMYPGKCWIRCPSAKTLAAMPLPLHW